MWSIFLKFNQIGIGRHGEWRGKRGERVEQHFGCNFRATLGFLGGEGAKDYGGREWEIVSEERERERIVCRESELTLTQAMDARTRFPPENGETAPVGWWVVGRKWNKGRTCSRFL